MWATTARRWLENSRVNSESAQPVNSTQPSKLELYEPANASGPVIRSFSKWIAVRTSPTSRFKWTSPAHSRVGCAPPAVKGIDGSRKLSKIAVRNELRNSSLTMMVASAPELLTRRPREIPVSCAVALSKHNSIRRTIIDDVIAESLIFISIGFLNIENSWERCSARSECRLQEESQSSFRLKADFEVISHCAQYHATGSVRRTVDRPQQRATH